MEKASFTRLNKLFEIDALEQNHKVLLSNKNLLALINEPKSFVIPVFSRVAPLSLVLGKHFVVKDLPFYAVALLVDSEACQASLEEREKKRQERMLRQTLTTSRLTFNFIVQLFAKKKKEPIVQLFEGQGLHLLHLRLFH